METNQFELTRQLAAMPVWQAAVVVLGVGTLLGVAGPLVLRRLFGLDRLRINNEVAGFKFAVVGVIYAVIVGFATIVVWEKFREAEMAAVQEAGAVAALLRLSDGLEPSAAQHVRDSLNVYLHSVIEDDWPAMNLGRGSAKVPGALDGLYDTVMPHGQHGPAELAVVQEMLSQLDAVTSARRARLSLAQGVVPSVLWLVLFSGGAVTVVFTFFFGSSSLVAQTLMNGLLSFLVAMSLFVIVEIAYPFTGPVSVSPEPLMLLLHRV
jgi:hypothetical protein